MSDLCLLALCWCILFEPAQTDDRMKNFFLALFVFGSLSSFTFIDAQKHSSSETTTTVIKLTEFSNKKCLSIRKLFEQDDSYVVVNSCEVLGLIVIDNKPTNDRLPHQSRLDLLTRISKNGISQDEIEFVHDMSKLEVMYACRAKANELFDAESGK